MSDRRASHWAAIALVGLLAMACSRTSPGGSPPAQPSPALPSPAATASPTATGGHVEVVASPSPAGSSSFELAAPQFHGTAAVIDEATRGRMKYSWHEGCPVPLEDLRLLTMDFWGMDGDGHRGEMVVHRTVADDVLAVFRKLFDARFPIARMELVDEYGGDDDRSMAANNTSGFNCRAATGHPGVWSEHSYGRAIDINPIENPYVWSGGVEPPEGARFANRSLDEPRMIHPGDVVVRAFSSVGWGWGGAWHSFQDYQHFSLTGK